MPSFRLLLYSFSWFSISVFGALPDNAEKLIAEKLAPLDSSQPNSIKKRFADIFDIMAQAEKHSAMGGEALLRQGIKLRNEYGPMKRDTTAAVIIAGWNYAKASGAFNSNNQFTGRITRGIDVGQQLVFEAVVPASVAPEFSNEFANYRLVAPSRARSSDSPLSHRDAAYLKTLQAIASETAGSDHHQLHTTQWEAQMTELGDQVNAIPKVRLSNRFKASPSGKNDYKWQVEVTVANATQIPTEITLECYIIGKLWKSKRACVLRKHSIPVKLKRSETRQVIAETIPREDCKLLMDNYEKLGKEERANSRVVYSGIVILARHSTGHLASAASHPALLNLITEGHNLSSELNILTN